MTNMKIYIEKWTTETVHTGRLFSVDTEMLRTQYEELQCLSDEEIAQHFRERHDEYYELLEETPALEARNSSADHCEDSFVNVYDENSLKRDLEWEAWRRGAYIEGLNRYDIGPDQSEAFLSQIPEYK